ncbi:MAG: helix-turn-helix domain-containing protein [Phycisphaerales bacterium]|nr:helix-turn-helix domain-containing protein [Planctomycetota bacterium]MCH8508883.1 helix-turn-helix domain-containing protein [Phycisphaerales bacterium]
MTPTNLISVQEAATRLSISRRSLERRIAEGLIDCVKIGRRTLISVAELDRFIRSQTKVVR